MTARVVAHTVVLLLMLSGISGCDRSSDSPDPPDPAESADSTVEDLPFRFVRRYLPFDARWVSEARIPIEAPKPPLPQMVIWEVSGFDPRIPATPEQQKAADDFVARCFQAAVEKNWFDQATGIADGFITPAFDKLHHRSEEYVLDDIQLDPERPEYLMYYPDPNRDGEPTLTGIMFLADGPESRGHQFAGPLAIWHYHKFTNPRCWLGGGLLPTGMLDDRGECPTGAIPLHRSPEMVHVWFIDHPRGPFSSGMTLPRNLVATGLAKRRELYGY